MRGAGTLLDQLKLLCEPGDISAGIWLAVVRSWGANYLHRRRGDRTWPARNQPGMGETSDDVLLKKKKTIDNV